MEVKNVNIRELKALLRMLDEPDAELFDNISSSIEQYGMDALPYLEKLADDFLDPLIKERSENIISKIRLNKLSQDLNKWKSSEKKDILEAWMMIESFLFPDYNYEVVNDKINKLTREIWYKSPHHGLNPVQKIQEINFFLFMLYNFKVKENKDFDDNFILNKIIENFSGNYVSTVMLYLVLSQKLGYPVSGYIVLESFFLAWINIEDNENFISCIEPQKVLFYISPYLKGEIFDDSQICDYLKKNNIIYKPEFCKAVSNIDVICFYLKHISDVLFNKNMFVKSLGIKKLLDVLR